MERRPSRFPRCARVLEQLPGDDEGLVYATPDAVDYSDITSTQDARSGDPYCGEDLNIVASAVLVDGVDEVVSHAKRSFVSGCLKV